MNLHRGRGRGRGRGVDLGGSRGLGLGVGVDRGLSVGGGLGIGAARSQRGSATAEFVVLIPAVCLVLALCLSALQLATRQLQVHDAAALAARSASRGGSPAALVNQLLPGASSHSERRGNLLCVRVETTGSPIASLLGFSKVSATSCALADGR